MQETNTITYKISDTARSFHKSDAFVRSILGPIGCLRGDTLVRTEYGTMPIAHVNRPMRVESWDEKSSRFVLSQCGGSFPKGTDYLYRVTTSQGGFVASGHHQTFCADHTYQRVEDLVVGQSLLVNDADPQPISTASFYPKLSPLSVRHCSQTVVDYLGDYARSARQCGQQLLSGVDTALASSPLRDDAQALTWYHDPSSDGQTGGSSVRSQGRNRQGQSDDRPCTGGSTHHSSRHTLTEARSPLGKHVSRTVKTVLAAPLSLLKTARRLLKPVFSWCSRSSYSASITERTIVSIERLDVKETYWDMQVVDTNNYVTADGAIHHNSGKSVACVMEMFLKSLEQKPNKQGIRKSRWVIVRNTYRELQDTTIQTFFDWIPESLGVMLQKNMTFYIDSPHPSGDGTKIQCEFMFRALDRPNDVKKLLSLEMTGAWINEARELPKAIIDMTIGRLGRYPNKRDGGPSWHGLIMDTNPPDSDHWYFKLFEETKPDNHALFHQPSGVAENAENVENLPPNYYTNMQAGKDKEWINVYVHGQYGFIADGKPVWPEYKDDIHHSDDELPLAGSGTIYVGIDFGLTPAAVIGQITASGQFQILDELVTEDMGAVSFGKLLHQKLNNEYCGCQLEVYADPAGEQRAQTDEQTPFMILSQQGVEAWPTYTNDFTIRREAVADYMQRLDFGGNPAFLLGPKAKMLRKALAGGYKYKRMQVTGEARFMDKPDKGRYSHVADALQYLFLGSVGGERVIGGYGDQPIDYGQTNRMVV